MTDHAGRYDESRFSQTGRAPRLPPPPTPAALAQIAEDARRAGLPVVKAELDERGVIVLYYARPQGHG